MNAASGNRVAPGQVLLRKGRRLLRRSPTLAAAHFAAAAEVAWAADLGRAVDVLAPDLAVARALYNEATARLAAVLPRLLAVSAEPGIVHLPPVAGRTGWRVAVPEFEADFLRRHTFLPARDLRARGLRARYVRPGIGGALVASRPNGASTLQEIHFPPEGIVYPTTALLRFPATESAGLTAVDFELRDAVRDRTIPWANGSAPLAADFSAPWAHLLARTAGLMVSGFAGMLRPMQTFRPPRLYLLEPYDPAKRVILMVHGLWSSPLAWARLTNDVWGVPELRRRYQIWHYDYPTGYPVLYNARKFRAELDATRRAFSPDLADEAVNHLVVVAHSMGGLLSRTLVTDSGMAVWDSLLCRRPESLRASPADRVELESMYVFRPHPAVRRVVYIATPHRGSAIASAWVGLFGSALVRLPEDLRALYERLLPANPDLLTDRVRHIFRRGAPNGIDSLSPRNPALEAMAALPTAAGVPFHSIHGHGRRGRPGPRATDSVVTYASSHLEGAESEASFPDGHGVFDHPGAAREVIRILQLDAREGPLPAK